MTFQDYLSETKTLTELCALWNEYAAEHAPEDYFAWRGQEDASKE